MKKKKMTQKTKSFYQGAGMVAYGLAKTGGYPSIAVDTLKCLGIDRKLLREAEVPESDLAIIYEDELNARYK